MSYIVTSLEKGERGRRNLCLDGRINLQLYPGEVRKYALEVGCEVSEETYQEILHMVLGKRAVKRAMHLLERQEKTEYQLREKLLLNSYPQEAIEDAIDYVKRYRYLDDERYARTFILFHQEKRSRARLKTDLYKRGISSETIEAALEEVFSSDEREKIKELLIKRRFPQSEGDEKEFQKNYQFLMRRGFKGSDILPVMKSMGQHKHLKACT